MLKKIVLLLIITVLISSILPGCGNKTNDAATTIDAGSTTTEAGDKPVEADAGATDSETPKELIIALAGDAYSLDPYPRNETITNAINQHIFDSLIQPDRDLQSEPSLAESWDISDDSKVWTFYLKEGVKFHNGNDFTADDVVFSLDRASLESSAFTHVTSTIDSYKVIDDYTIEITCNEPNALLLSHIRDLMIMDKESCEEQDDDWIALNPNGTGRYKLVEHVREDKIVLERNDDFWGELPEATKVTFKPISNEGTRTANMISGAVDFIADVPVRDVETLEANDKITVIKEPSLRIIYINLAGWSDTPSRDADIPLKSPDGSNPFKDIKVREAMYRAINEEEIIEKVMNGYGEPAASYIPVGYNGYNPDIKRLEYDPELAEKLLDEAGYEKQSDGYRFEVTLDASNDRYVNDGEIATAITGYFEKVGIKVNLNLMSRTIFFGFIRGTNDEGDNTHLCMTGWADSGGEGALMGLDLIYSMSQDGYVKDGYGGVNRGYYQNPEVDKLIDKGISTPDPKERDIIIQEAWKIAADDISYIPLHFEKDIYAFSSDLSYEARKHNYIYAWDIKFNK